MSTSNPTGALRLEKCKETRNESAVRSDKPNSSSSFAIIKTSSDGVGENIEG
jgi:hypothetical protein